MPPCKRIPSLTKLALGALGKALITTTKSVSKTSFAMCKPPLAADCPSIQEAERRAFLWVDGQVDQVKEVLFSSVPHYCFQPLVQTIVDTLTEAAHNSKAIYRKVMASSPESIHEIHVIVRFVRLVTHPRIHNLDLSSMPKLLRDCIYKHLDVLTGLESLNLGSGSGETGRRRMFMSLKNLQFLHTLILTNDCQNETLAVLGQNCKHLQKLDINSSSAVTDQGVTWLVQCPKLTHLDLYQTSISVEAYAQLLLGLKRLETVGRCDAFGQVLEYLHLYNTAPVLLAVTNFHSRDMSFEQLKLLVRMCPKLRHVNLYVDEDMGNLLEPFEELEDLQELKLLACNFYSDGINQLLRKKGPGLSSLHLEHVDELDMSALCCIAETCINLKKLVFFSCDFVENFGASLVNRLFVKRPFQALEDLVCVSESAPNVIEFLLIHASNLKRIKFGSTAWFNDETVASVTAKGALTKVEEIKILRSYEITMKSVELLLKVCPRLKVLAEMDGWEAITELELVRLRNRIREENMELDTYSSWIISG